MIDFRLEFRDREDRHLVNVLVTRDVRYCPPETINLRDYHPINEDRMFRKVEPQDFGRVWVYREME